MAVSADSSAHALTKPVLQSDRLGQTARRHCFRTGASSIALRTYEAFNALRICSVKVALGRARVACYAPGQPPLRLVADVTRAHSPATHETRRRGLGQAANLPSL